ncbi:MAG: cupin domain-containing protein [Oceanicaulis sp.]|uniref:cupin domain-containing protein n=1 Tax=Glycocaulis sp. TaxID=1969725 RepID=UPI0025BD9185|nr:cupin domain-containing protein [Glycocaulis sp.]MCC5980886.1 cupin domain-containing protein [Oceanicaulis sp.]MCH8521064.1 cupin domain-containing protein [Glycocaulis sp.]
MPAIDDGLLLDHAAGNGPRALQLLAECQSEINPVAGGRTLAAEAVFGTMLDELGPASLRPDALSDVLGHLGEAERAGEAIAQDGIPAPLQTILNRQTGGELRWHRRLGGVREIVLEELCEGETEASLIQLMPGGGIPDHNHGGEELTLILSGAFHDGRALYRAGDLCSAAPGTRHRPRVRGDEPCICLAVSLAPWKPANPLYGVADRLTRPKRPLKGV